MPTHERDHDRPASAAPEQAVGTAGGEAALEPAPVSLSRLATADVASRARVLSALQGSAGNRAVAAAIQREPAPEPDRPDPAAVLAEALSWSVAVRPGGAAPKRVRRTQDPLEVFRGDEVTIRATIAGLEEIDQASIEMSELPVDVIGELASHREGWEGPDTYAWTFTPIQPGPCQLHLKASAHGASRDWIADLKIFMDFEDLIAGVVEAGEIVDARFAAAEVTVGDAALAWKGAYDRQKAVLDAASAQQALAEEMLIGVLFACAAGGVGGAVGGFMKNTKMVAELGEVRKLVPDDGDAADVAAGFVTDAAKDTAKYVVRTIRRFNAGGSAPVTPGDSVDAPASPGPQDRGIDAPGGDDPYTFLVKLGKQLSGERSLVATELARIIGMARDARVVSGIEEFEEDPLLIANGDNTFDLLAGIETEQTAYLARLWTTWLSNYAYEIKVLRMRETAAVIVGSNLTGALDTGIRADAEACGTTFEAWLTEHAEPLKARLEAELAEQGVMP